ncbi:MAG: WbqC family protein [Saprospiraceae bacterium]|nr:WbqC family protein [Saprospiraceae bacterium]MBP9209917.1 WbqC family protein [Saprospiraceae bacterium]
MQLIIHTCAFPPIHLMALMLHAENTLLDRTENYQKGSARNRYLLGTHQGSQMLSFPLKKGKNQQMPIGRVCIAEGTHWRNQHARALQTAYGKSPFFAYYSEGLFEVLFEPCNDLLEFNDRALGFICTALQTRIAPQWMESSGEWIAQDATDVRHYKIRDWLQLGPNPVYEQVFGGIFQSKLSVLDLMFHLGPECVPYLRNWTPHIIPALSTYSPRT